MLCCVRPQNLRKNPAKTAVLIQSARQATAWASHAARVPRESTASRAPHSSPSQGARIARRVSKRWVHGGACERAAQSLRSRRDGLRCHPARIFRSLGALSVPGQFRNLDHCNPPTRHARDPLRRFDHRWDRLDLGRRVQRQTIGAPLPPTTARQRRLLRRCQLSGRPHAGSSKRLLQTAMQASYTEALLNCTLRAWTYQMRRRTILLVLPSHGLLDLDPDASQRLAQRGGPARGRSDRASRPAAGLLVLCAW